MRLAETVLGSHGQYEAQLRVNLKDKYFPVVEVGYGTADADEVTSCVNRTPSMS